jgi:polyhydroxyalkanoate synthesis regulator phasin
MDSSMKRKVVAGTVAALAVGGTGAGIAATKLGGSPSAESKAVVNDAAKQLGVQPAQLTDAIKKALSARVDAAVAAGRLTKEQGAEMKARIASDNFPLFGPQAFDGGHFGHRGGPGLDAAAKYLGLTEAKLQAQLESGKTLAQVATAQNKTVDGLIAALKADAKQKLDDAVKVGRLSQAQETQILADLDQRITGFVNGKLMRHERRFEGRPFGGGRPDGNGGPPAGFSGAAA